MGDIGPADVDRILADTLLEVADSYLVEPTNDRGASSNITPSRSTVARILELPYAIRHIIDGL